MNSKMYNCEDCEYKTPIKCNYQKHLNCKHKKIENIITDTMVLLERKIQIEGLQSENEKLKAEIETLKANHALELLQLKVSIYENQSIRTSRSPAKPSPKNDIIHDIIPKKPHNMPPLEYLNKYFPPLDHNGLDEIVSEKLLWQDIPLSCSNLENQYISILKPLIEKYQLVFHSGEKNHSLKFYYVNHLYEWVEDLTDLEYLCYIIYKKIQFSLIENCKSNKYGSEEKTALMMHYNKELDRKYVAKQMIDVMKLPTEYHLN